MHKFSFTFLLMLLLLQYGLHAKEYDKRIEKKAHHIHEKVLTIDTHCDTPMKFFEEKMDIGIKHDPYTSGLKVDFSRMKEGGLDAQFFAIFIAQRERTPGNIKKVRGEAFRILSKIKDETLRYPDLAEIATNPEDAYRLEREGKRAVFIGLENGFPIGDDLSVLKKFYDNGVRYVTLCHTSNNDICDSSNDRKGPEHGGLSGFGKEVVKEMNKLGMIVDVSHSSDSSFFDVIEISRAPVIASHSCARAICDNPRNLNDEQLLAIAKNGGVVQMCILSDYVKKPEPFHERDSVKSALLKKYNHFEGISDEKRREAWREWDEMNRRFPPKLASVSDVADHIDYIVKIAGIDHVGIGTDFDGGGALSDCYDVSQMENITIELVKRGYSEEAIRKIWGGNFIRVFRKVIETGKLIREDIANKSNIITGS